MFDDTLVWGYLVIALITCWFNCFDLWLDLLRCFVELTFVGVGVYCLLFAFLMWVCCAGVLIFMCCFGLGLVFICAGGLYLIGFVIWGLGLLSLVWCLFYCGVFFV